MEKKKVYIILFIILLLGAFLRFYNIGTESFWLDEGLTALVVKNYDIKQIFANTYFEGQILPGYYISNLDLPIYYILVELWTNIFGISESSVRMISAIFGFLSIIAVYFLGKELFNQKVGIIAAFVFSLNLTMIEYSQEARLYSLLVFTALSSGYFLIKFIDTDKNSYFIAFITANIFGIYTHYPFIFFAAFEAAFVIYLIYSRFKFNIKSLLKSNARIVKTNLKKIYLAFFILFLAYLPLLPRLINPRLVTAHFTGTMTIGKLIKMLVQMNGWIYPSTELLMKIESAKFNFLRVTDWALITSFGLIVLLLFVFFVLGISRMLDKKTQLVYLVLWLFLPALLAFAALYSTISTFASIRYIIFIIPAYLIIASYGISTLRYKGVIAFALVFITFSAFPILSYYENVNNPQYREVMGFLKKNFQTRDIIITSIESIRVPLMYYSDGITDIYGVSKVGDAEKLVRNKESIWLVISMAKYSDPNEDIKGFFDRNYKLLEEKDFFNVKVRHYSKK